MFLAGDHNLGGNANPPTQAYLAAPSTGTPFIYLGTNFNTANGPAFMDTMHAKQGNVGLADGSVEYFSRTELQNALRNSGDRGRAAGTFVMAAGVTAGIGCNRIQLP
jgi:prepilin-type processing-associated H-X9-DG protein